eukprot:GFYU01001158.1.p1 GENE.GFYU01001158.1~~GFYU01001158.1.p1  ORF type:complete len:375 (+),score=136.21 GFYU01001158.1:148-1272(+)
MAPAVDTMTTADAPVDISEEKTKGNELFKKAEYKEAAVWYSKALKKDPKNLACLSNRSAAFSFMGRHKQGLGDAELCIKIDPTWPKGYFRKAKILKQMGDALGSMEALNLSLGAEQKLSGEKAGKDIVKLMDDFVKEWRKDDKVTKEQMEGIKEIHTQARKQFEKKVTPPPPVVPAPTPSASTEGMTAEEIAKAKKVEALKKLAGMKLGQDSPVKKADNDEEFVKNIVHNVTATLMIHGELAPMCYFRTQNPDEDNPELMVGIQHAFTSPDNHSSCMDFLRIHQRKLAALSGVIAVPKSIVEYPQVWEGRTKQQWPYPDDNDGVFVQLETHDRAGRRCWFIPLMESNVEGAVCMPGNPVELPIDFMAIMDPIMV